MLLKSSLIYLLCHFSSISQGILTKYITSGFQDIAIKLFNFLLLRAFFVMILTAPFAVKYFIKVKQNYLVVFFLTLLASLDTIFYNLSLRTVPVNLVVIIMLTVPLFINIFSSIILKEKSNKKDYIFLILCLIGVFKADQKINPFYILGNNHNIHFTTDLMFIFLTVFVVVLGLILQKKYSDKRPIPLAIFLNAFFLFLISLLFKEQPILKTINFNIIFFAFIVALFDITDFFAVYKSYQMSNLSKLQPVRFTRIIISIFMSYFFLKEEPTKNQIVGTLIIIIANICNLYSKNLISFLKTK